ncbi:hypothetical protein NA57DRAFT_24429, partial [Rhizodiscina lignyota]
IVTVEVTNRSETKSFFLHEGLLCHNSSYFKAAINGGFAESSKRVIPLSRTSINVMEAFQMWLYNGKLFGGAEDMGYTFLFQIWVFGDMLGVPGLQNAAIDSVHKKISTGWSIPSHRIDYVYQNTPSGSALRKYVVDM